MNKKIIASMILSIFFISGLGVYADGISVMRTDKKDYSSAGEKPYQYKRTAEQEKALEEARKEYASPESDMAINIKPMFDDWTRREAQAKVNNIGTKILVSNNILNFARFTVTNKQAVNAHTNDSEVYVDKGLLEYVETEDELAYVIGHELAHLTNRDATKTTAARVAIASLAVAGALVGGSGGKNNPTTAATGSGLAVGALAGAVGRRQFSKHVSEENADKKGIDYMVRAGYNPLASISMMNKIMNRKWDIISDHKSGDKRMMVAYDYIGLKYPKYLKVGYDTISYNRALDYILIRKKQRAEKAAAKAQNANNKQSKNNKESEL